MRNEMVPFLVIGWIFIVDHWENKLIEYRDRHADVMHASCVRMIDDREKAQNEALADLDVYGYDLHKAYETFRIGNVVYHFEEPEFTNCVGTKWNIICSRDEWQYMVLRYTVRNDSDKRLLNGFQFELEHVHDYGELEETWWKLADQGAENAIEMSGDGVLIYEVEPNAQMSGFTVFEIHRDATDLRLKTSVPILEL